MGTNFRKKIGNWFLSKYAYGCTSCTISSDVREQRRREKIEMLMIEWGFKDASTAEAYYKLQQRQLRQKNRKKQNEKLKDPQVIL